MPPTDVKPPCPHGQTIASTGMMSATPSHFREYPHWQGLLYEWSPAGQNMCPNSRYVIPVSSSLNPTSMRATSAAESWMRSPPP